MSEDKQSDADVLLEEASQEIARLDDELARLRHAPIAVIGTGMRFPGGANDASSFWNVMHTRHDAVIDLPKRWAQVQFLPAEEPPADSRFAGLVDNVDMFDPEFFGIAPREALTMDPQQRFVLETAWEALETAGYAANQLKNTPTGVFIGSATHDYEQTVQANPQAWDAFAATGAGNSFSPARVSYLLGLQGPSFNVDTACSSSLLAVHLACQSLRSGESELALAGGVSLILSPVTMGLYHQLQVMSPDGRCKTFDTTANGFVRGEGCGIVVLKRLADAQRDGDTIVAVIRGSASKHDGRSAGMTAPNMLAQVGLLKMAMRNAQVSPEQVTYVEAHGTGTPLGDAIEMEALTEVFGAAPRTAGEPVVVGSVKTNIGHIEAASGVAGLIKIILAMQHETVPPLLHFTALNPRIRLDVTPFVLPLQPLAWKRGTKPRIAGLSSFGLSGTNVHAIIEEPPRDARTLPDAGHAMHLLTLSARSEKALRTLAQRYHDALTSAEAPPLADVCFTANTGRVHHGHRLALLAKTTQEAATRLAAFAKGEASPNISYANVSASPTPTVAYLFAGEGDTHHSCINLFNTQPVFRASIEACDAALAQTFAPRLSKVMLGEVAAETLPNRAIYQAAGVFAFEVATYDMWKAYGVVPAIVASHGLGAYAAAYAAGILSLQDALRLIVAPHAAAVTYNAPALPFVSAQTGQIVSAEQTLTAAYFDGQVRAAAPFEKSLAALAEADTFVEIGFSGGLSAAAIQSVANANQKAWIQSGKAAVDPWTQAMTSLALLYTNALDVIWRAVHAEGGRRVPLPTYPFQRKRFWLGGVAVQQPAAARTADLAAAQEVEFLQVLAAAPAVQHSALMVQLVRDCLAEVLGSVEAVPVNARKPLLEAGLNSLMAVELARKLSTRLGIKLPATTVIARPHIEAIAQNLLEKVQDMLPQQATPMRATGTVPSEAIAAPSSPESELDDFLSEIEGADTVSPRR